VKAAAAFHQRLQDAQLRLERANAEVIRIRQWLHRQQASLTPTGEIIWARSKRLVLYDREAAARDLTRVEIRHGCFLTHRGRPLDTRHMVTHFSGPGCAIYVVSREGKLHVASHSLGHRHHSSLLAGQAVAGAGELRVRDGRLEWISNKSGHFRPDHFLFVQTVELLAGRGVTYLFEIPYVWGHGGRQLFHSLAAFKQAHAVAEQRAAAELAARFSAEPGDSHYSN
jgi:hypothetical protein